MTAARKVDITTGPHGKNTHIAIDGVPVENARAFTLSAEADGATTLTITYVNVEARVDGLIETWDFNSDYKTYFAPTEPPIVRIECPEVDLVNRRTRSRGGEWVDAPILAYTEAGHCETMWPA